MASFQSPYGGRGRSDFKMRKYDVIIFKEFQSPCGGRGRSDSESGMINLAVYCGFQSPYGGRGRSDSIESISSDDIPMVSITLRWQG